MPLESQLPPWHSPRLCDMVPVQFPASHLPLLSLARGHVQHNHHLPTLCLPRTVEHLGILTGAQLFSLNREELKKVCGDEGNRVYSKITVEKNQLEVSVFYG